MPEMKSYDPGSFCWVELTTNNAQSAKDFYSKVFGWGINDQPMGPDQFYTMLEVGGKSIAGLYGMDKEQLARGIPPHWNVYVSVANVDESTKKAETLGATTILPPFDVMDVGRMSGIQDPTGAIIFLWQAKQHSGSALVGDPGSFCWWELNTKDTEKAKAFYTGLFGWAAGGDPNYTEWKKNDTSIGGMMQIQPEWGEVPPNWLAYVAVENADATAEKIKASGGSIMMGPQDIPNMGRFAVAADPQRAAFAIYQPAAK
jgi:predicted enzyme related to lactoylglutathione lyase